MYLSLIRVVSTILEPHLLKNNIHYSCHIKVEDLTKHIGSISCHIMPLVAIASAAGTLTHTHTHARTHTHTHTQTHFLDKSNFKKPGSHWPINNNTLVKL